MGKTLWTAGEEGAPIAVYAAFNEQDEARFVIDRIQQGLEQGAARADFAILYRSNAQSRNLEETLLGRGIPYRVYGGLRFFERAEIKDALAYLRLVNARADDPSFERVVNTPPRGIGERSVGELRQLAREKDLSLWQAAEHVVADKALAARALNAIRAFLDLIDTVTSEISELPLHLQLEELITRSGLRDHYAKDRSERGEAKVENLDELITAARTFEQEYQSDEGMDTLTAFLSHAALEAGEGQADKWQDAVQLMTLHSAKGLEFPTVFLVGLEEGLFPHRMSADDPKRLEEERRLCYVGITRARERLCITFAERRRLHGVDNSCVPSRFLQELPPELLEEVRSRFSVTRPAYAQAAPAASLAGGGAFALGQAVQHEKFGEGVVLKYEGSGASSRIQVNFAGLGSKWLVAAYANLKAL
jgi:DNA helicase II / ATP-dependent DNA helicase PcrA